MVSVLSAVLPVLAVLAVPTAAPAGAASAPPPHTAPVAPGVDLAVRALPGEPRHSLTSLTVDLGSGPRVHYIDGGSVASTAEPADMAAAHPPPGGETAVAAVNGDFFDAGASYAPLGAAVRDGEVLSSPAPDRPYAAVIGEDGRGSVRRVRFEGTVRTPSGTARLDALNAPGIPEDGLGLFTDDWGSASRARAVHGAERVAEAVLADGAVRKVRDRAGDGRIEPGTRVLVGRGAGADLVAELSKGMEVEADYRIDAGGVRPRTVLGGHRVLLRDGRPTGAADGARQPRTVLGFGSDGTRMAVVAADGRVPGALGATLGEAAEAVKEAGADEAIELDGGGSSALLARGPGGRELTARNRTGEGPREVPNGLLVTAPAGDGVPSGLWLRPRTDPRPGPGVRTPAQDDPYFLFPGMRRTLEADLHDAAFGPAGHGDRVPELRLSAPTGSVQGRAYRGGDPGRVEVTGTASGVRGGVELQVLPGPERLAPEPERLFFPGEGGSSPFVVSGVAPDGTRAPVEPQDVRVEADPDLVKVEPHNDGRFEVHPVAGKGAGEVTVEAGGVRAEVPVAIGSTTERLSSFEDGRAWTAEGARAEAGLRPIEGRYGRGIAVRYDFTGSARTRAATARPPEPLPARPAAFGFGLQVKGDGEGATVALSVVDDAGIRHAVYGPRVAWKGWRPVEFPVPDDAVQPVSVTSVYLVETDGARSYEGEVAFSDLTGELGRDPEPSGR
ncbi:phosphodiester glycosidase family protein [Nocardiopsis sp. RSe5-2]|uniref:Phosphodiester glycosidase family protein n=1 Tax=Nocardiopsis endophytica TaxID=3018445 RepID=A0ABT4TWT1_9ACTN|nr:phosphodiester glycosidase family protein [Nocardiopsis endophytica]MDA2809153.1 phosphodiester glycosidase family protein [Nocardiopsis endophytica]